MNSDRPFHRIVIVTKQEAALEQIEGAIQAFHAGRFSIAITLACAAEEMAPVPSAGVWRKMLSNPNRPIANEKPWSARLNETRNWLKHKTEPLPDTRALVATEVAFYILRAMDRWEPWSPSMIAFKELYFNSPRLLSPEDAQPAAS